MKCLSLWDDKNKFKCLTCFIETESSEKIQRALRSNVRTYMNEEFVTCETVYYRRSDGMALLKY